MNKEVEKVDEELQVISRYSRKEALGDGVLVDVSEMAREAGLRFPVALTRAVHEQYVVVPPGVGCQDYEGRLWDVVYMLRIAISAGDRQRSEIRFRLYVRNDNRKARLVELKAICGPGDEGEPVITVLLPSED